MRVEVSPTRLDVAPGQSLRITIAVTNTSTVIGGYAIRVLGADPHWVKLEADSVSLFPDESRTVSAQVTLPAGLQAGTRRIAVQVRELTPPRDIAIREIDLTVPAARAVRLTADPVAVTGGRQVGFSLIAENTGNTIVDGRLDGDDAEQRVGFLFDPEILHLAPGEQAVIDMQVRARRALIGQPRVRPLSLYLDDATQPALLADPAAAPPREDAARDERESLATATFIQKPVISRGALSLFALMLTISVFATVITVAMSRLVNVSKADRNLALAVAAAQGSNAPAAASSLAGTVKLLTSGAGVRGVSVNVYSATDLTTAVATTATDASGAWKAEQLAAGQYKVSFRGAGFTELWWPNAATPDTAQTITLAAGTAKVGVNASLGGVPGTITGSVNGTDYNGATLYLETAKTGTATSADWIHRINDPSSATAAAGSAAAAPAPPGYAIVQKVAIAADGSFTLANVPSPSNYVLVLSKPGYAASVQELDLGAGENRSAVALTLTKGNGQITGSVSNGRKGLPAVTVTATSGQTLASTVSLSATGKVGQFALPNLPTPATFTLVASAPGYTSQTLTLTLSDGQQLDGVVIALAKSSGTLSGRVTSVDRLGGPQRPAGNVTISATDGLTTVRTQSQPQGSWRLDGLALPGTYTITFSRPDLASQTVSVALDARGTVSTGSQGVAVTGNRVTVTMQPAVGTVTGTIYQTGTSGCGQAGPAAGAGSGRVPEASVTLTQATTTYSVVSASSPPSSCGRFAISNVPPGTYTLTVTAGAGTSPYSQPVLVTAGAPNDLRVTLSPIASITGKVEVSGPPASGWWVFLYASSDYPNGTPRAVQTDGDGNYSFAGVDAGQYVLAAGPTSDPNNAERTVFVTVQPSQQEFVPIALTAAIGGNVIGHASGWSVALFRSADYPGRSALRTQPVNGDGTYAFASVAPGNYVLTAGPAGNAQQAGPVRVTVQADQQAKVNIRVSK